MKLGPVGEKWVYGLNELFTMSSSLCTSWQQDFFTSFTDKAEKFGEGAFVTEKQVAQLNKIADVYGYPELDPAELDND